MTSARSRVNVSIVTPHYGDGRTLTALKNALLDQTYNLSEVEWIVVDDASPYDPPEWYQDNSLPFDLKWHNLMRNRGRAGARNAGVKRANGKIIVLIDADMVPSRSWLQLLVDSVKCTGAVIVGRSKLHPRHTQTAYLKYAHSRGPIKHTSGDFIPGKYFTTQNSAMKASLFKEYGLFDEQFTGWGGEDLEIGLRWEQAGVPFLFQGRAVAFHDHLIDMATMEARYLEYGSKVVPILVSRFSHAEEVLSLHKLYRVSPYENIGRWVGVKLYQWICDSKVIYSGLKAAVELYPRAPWPDIVFDYLRFSLYSRTWRAMRRKDGAA